MDIRHRQRIKIVQELYAAQFTNPTNTTNPTNKTNAILKSFLALNSLIKKHAPKFPLEKIAKIDLAILRLAIFELVIEKKEPPKVIINEAVELAKELGSEKSYSFINAVLGKVYDEQIQKFRNKN